MCDILNTVHTVIKEFVYLQNKGRPTSMWKIVLNSECVRFSCFFVTERRPSPMLLTSLDCRNFIIVILSLSIALCLAYNTKGSFTPDVVSCGALRHRAACCVVFIAYRKVAERRAVRLQQQQDFIIIVIIISILQILPGLGLTYGESVVDDAVTSDDSSPWKLVVTSSRCDASLRTTVSARRNVVQRTSTSIAAQLNGLRVLLLAE